MPQKTKFDDGTWKHEIRKISDLHPNPDNPRTITKETLKGLKKSMEKNGYTHRIIIDSHNMILSGHARWLVFKEKDPNAEIEVLAAQRELTEDEIKNAVIGHNIDGGEWNIEDLQMKFDPIMLQEYGLEVDKAEDFDTKEVEEVETPEEVPTRVKQGEIWQLGDHRLICGDSTKADDVNALLNGNKADCSVNIYCFLQAQATQEEIKAICSIGDTHVNVNGELVPFTEIVEEARKYIKQLGGFEALACWGLQ